MVASQYTLVNVERITSKHSKGSIIRGGGLEVGSLVDYGVLALERGVAQCSFVGNRLTYFFQHKRAGNWIWI